MTLNGVMAVTLRYFTEFGKPELQHIRLPRALNFDQESASITHRAVKYACVTKCKDFSMTYF